MAASCLSRESVCAHSQHLFLLSLTNLLLNTFLRLVGYSWKHRTRQSQRSSQAEALSCKPAAARASRSKSARPGATMRPSSWAFLWSQTKLTHVSHEENEVERGGEANERRSRFEMKPMRSLGLGLCWRCSHLYRWLDRNEEDASIGDATMTAVWSLDCKLTGTIVSTREQVMADC
jgi:hypothetical protein